MADVSKSPKKEKLKANDVDDYNDFNSVRKQRHQ